MPRFRKLIELTQETEIMCDNPVCDFKVENLTKNPDLECKRFLNVPCPECGQNLLTEEDYKTWLMMHKYVNFINKWFSWVTIFLKEPKEERIVKAHVHKGVKFTELK
jgi:hypothetical protein